MNECVHQWQSHGGSLTTWVGSKISSSKGRGALSPRGMALNSAGARINVDAFLGWSGLLSGNARETTMAWPADKRKDSRIQKSI